MAPTNFVQSYNEKNTFPKSLVRHNSYEHTLDTYVDRLENQKARLFLQDESLTSLKSWTFNEQTRDFLPVSIENRAHLENHVAGPVIGLNAFQKHDPKAQFFFIEAQDARSKLKITKEMLMTLFTYRQVMAPFLDFLFPFGKQRYPVDFHFSAFRSESFLSDSERGLDLPSLKRSGKEYRMCYNLKSVERSSSQGWPWSIRHTATYHSFDTQECKAFWVMIKGESMRDTHGKGQSLIRERITKSTRKGGRAYLDVEAKPENSFLATLEAHNVIFDMAAESWRWYIGYLEEDHQAKTLQVLTDDYNTPFLPEQIKHQATVIASDGATKPPVPGIFSRTGTFLKQTVKSATFPARIRNSAAAPIPLTTPVRTPRVSTSQVRTVERGEGNDFTITDVQQIQNLEEKAGEALLVIDSNIKILSSISDYYKEVFETEDFPDSLKLSCKTQMARFHKNIENIINDLKMQHSRASTLQLVLRDRKDMAYEIFNYRNMQASLDSALKAQASTDEMHEMTTQMKALAIKTKKETVSMKIITLVTLFFLPGTFISTIMSTDIIQYPIDPSTGQPMEQYSSGALKLYLAITVPLMALTFLSWGVLYWYIEQKGRTKVSENLGSGV